MNTNTTALDKTQYLIENLFQSPMKMYKTFGSEDVFYFDSIGVKTNEIVSSTYGKYSSNVSLLDALLEERAIEKKFDN